MKLLPLVAVLGILSLTLPPVTRAGDYIVVLKDDIGTAAVTDAGSAAVARRAVRAAARRHRAAPSFVYAHALRGYAATLSDAALARAQADPAVVGVVVDAWFKFSDVNSPQIIGAGVRRIGGLASPSAHIDGVDERVNADIAIIDSGVDLSHPDLNVAGSVDCGTSGLAPFVDHGTMVAGIAAAIDNGIGVVGAAPGARIWNIKVAGKKGEIRTKYLLCALDWVAGHSAVVDVANMSIEGPGADNGNCGVNAKGKVIDPLHAAVCSRPDAGVIP